MIVRWLIVLVLLTGIGAFIWRALPEVVEPMEVGSQSVAFSLPDLSGHKQTLPKGQVVLLNFWATWCPPCRQEIPSMVELYKRFAPSGLKVIAVSVDQRQKDLSSFVKEYQIPYEVLHDGNAVVSHRYGVFRYPESFLIDRNGVVRRHVVGAVDWLSKPVLGTIKAMLAKPGGHAVVASAAGG